MELRAISCQHPKGILYYTTELRLLLRSLFGDPEPKRSNLQQRVYYFAPQPENGTSHSNSPEFPRLAGVSDPERLPAGVGPLVPQAGSLGRTSCIGYAVNVLTVI